ncbi:MAG: BMP family ABC transporter substrate-binding protein [Actinomycetota bacterium]|nr:BMP family ABC transporter substrate-binding protein [Actinomycetota bacterium]MDH4353246.1 BMP family ABC transporter substrate-binding protein [Actinomycetota bacterium]MDH5277969.1 BMP family ABC transporter substrate-binding protein [Actinomycetota bacterium]
MRRVTTLASVIFAGALALTACGGDDTASPAASGGPTSDIQVGLAYDIGGRGDQSFNDSAALGLDKAAADFGVGTKELEASNTETDADKAERLRLLAEGGYNPVIAIGFAYATALAEVAPEYPDTNFAIVDDSSVEEPNVAGLVFTEEQGSFLVGTVAAQASTTGKIGFVGGVNTPLIQKFQAGYVAGAEAVNPDIKVQVKYLTQAPDFSGFNDPAKGNTAAGGMFDNGADVVYHAAGGSGSGVFDAAAAAGGLAIGVDSDQYLTAAPEVKDVVITSMIKRVDVAVYDYIQSAVDGATLTGVQTFDLAAEGVGYSLSNPAVEPYTAETDAYADQIINGEITVPTTP